MQGVLEIARLSPIVVPIFVSNLGCRHRCVFCDQSQFSKPVDPDAIPGIVREFISFSSRAGERRRIIAFYGGSFTGIRESLLERYLEVGKKLVKEGVVHGLKASTRPDMISGDILDRLVDSGFVELELGAQSMDDDVLEKSERGHSALDVERAAAEVKDSGLLLGLQIMPGLPGEDRESFKSTVARIAELGPGTTRIYPTVVMKGTRLEEMYDRGDFVPLGLGEAVDRALYARSVLESGGTEILRMGLPQATGLKVVDGPFHEAFGFLVKSRGFELMARRLGTGCTLRVNPRNVQELVGYKRKNIEDLGFVYDVDESVPEGGLAKGLESPCLYFKDIINDIL